MLFYPSGAPKPTRIQGAFIDDKEVENLVRFVKKDGDDIYDTRITEFIDNNSNPEQVEKKKKGGSADEGDDDGTDPLLDDAIDYVIEYQTASATFLQSKLKVGYSRARRILDQIEEQGIISGYQGSKPRTVLVTRERWEELNSAPKSNGGKSSGGKTGNTDNSADDGDYDESYEDANDGYDEASDDGIEYVDDDSQEYDDEYEEDGEYEDDDAEYEDDDPEYEDDDSEYEDGDIEYEDEEDL